MAAASSLPPPASIPAAASISRPDEADLRAVIEELADIDRAPASPGEREAAHLIAGRFQGSGLRVEVEDEPAFGSYAWPVGVAAAAAAAAGVMAGYRPQRTDAGRRGSRSGSLPGSLRRAAGTLGGALAAAGIADEISLGRQAIRRLISPRRTTCNVVGYAGDQNAARTLVVMAHHDAAPSGIVFDQRLQRWFAARYPGVVERMTENPPLWWPVVAGPALVAIGSGTGSRALRATGTVMSAIAAAAFADIGLRGPVPGANDNLSAVAVLVALARSLSERPTEGLRVILLSAGAEEALQQGARAFARRHFPALPRERTSFLNLDTVGSGRLVLLDGEGPLRMEWYDTGMTELVARLADELGIFLHRGLRSRNSTDGVVPMRAGYPAATLVSVDGARLLPHYHLYSDTPQNVDYRCVADAAQLTEAVVRAGGAPLV
ncbi:MAG TPA: M28 family peptidase [Streptosporangiaceae bacterium]|nr:M28 family peptidase [Streptosporangiaceae bacterium]